MPERFKARAILGAGCLWLAFAAGCVSGAEEPPAFAEYIGGHSYANWQGTISDGLMYLLKR